jgi:Zn-dependent protease
VTAALFGFVAQLLPHSTRLPGLAALIVLMNLTIAFFNILPVPPLDGASILAYLLARRPQVMVFFERQGFTLLIGLLLLDSVAGGRILGTLIGLPVSFLSNLFLGRLTLL